MLRRLAALTVAAPALLAAGCSDAFPGGSLAPSFPGGPGASSGSVPAIALNEVMAANDSTVMHGALAFPDWVELVNEDVAALPLSRVSLRDGGDHTWVGPTNQAIAPGDHLVLWGGDAGGWDSLGFDLDADHDTLTLAIDGVDVETLSLANLDADVSLARFPGDTWARTARATPGAPNGNAPGSDDPSSVFFGADRIHDVYLTLDDAGIASLSADPYTEVPGSLAFEGAWFPEVGIRLKGVHGSLRSLNQKCSFKVDVNQYTDHRLRGLETLAFNNLVQDPSYIHEFLTYSLYRAMGLPAPRVGWVRVYLNGTWMGLYAMVEYPDDRLLHRWYDDPSGNLYEGEYGEDFTADYLWEFDQDEGPDDNDRADLAALIAALDVPADDAGLANLGQILDLDQFVTYMAVEAAVYHWDGYTTRNNYRVYHDPSSGLFTMLPWGADQTWVDARYEAYQGGGRLMEYCMANAGCRARYGQALRDVADVQDGLQLEAQMDAALTLLAADMAADPRREWGMDTVNSYIDATRAELRASPGRIRAEAAAQGN